MKGLVCMVWSDEEQRDLLWYTCREESDGTYTVTIPFSDFGYQNGTYNILVYSDGRERANVLMGSSSFVMEDSLSEQLQVELDNQKINDTSLQIEVGSYDYTTGRFDIYINNIESDREILSVKSAVWSDENQEDLCWYEGQKQVDGSYLINVFARDFKFKESVYNIHVYVIDDMGNSTFCGSATGEIT